VDLMRSWTCSGIVALVAALGSQIAMGQAEPADDEASPFDSLDWKRGPTDVDVGANAALKVPEGYAFLDAAGTAKFMELTQNPASGDEYTIAPESLDWFAVVQFEDTGYIKDDEQIDADALLESLKEGTEAGNEARRSRGWPEMHITGWRVKPRYDQETRHLEWAIDAQSEGESVTNFNTRILGRRGVTSVTLVQDPARLDATIPEFKRVLAGYDFKQGDRYAEFKPGDKVAEYGLAALVAGGAAAVAVKSGLLKGLWKFLVVGAVAAFGGVRALFRRRKAAALQ
jgi:uncharacterized membrane-anchored protein